MNGSISTRTSLWALAVVLSAGAASQGAVIAHYRFDGTLADSSGNGFDGTSPRPPDFSLDGVFGESASFTAASRTLVEVADPTLFLWAQELTIAFWIKPLTWAGSPRFCQKGGDFDCRFQAPGSLEFHMNRTGGRYDGRREDLAPLGQWTHLAAVVEPQGGLHRIYVNGTEIGTNSSRGITQVTSPFLIGAKQNSPGSWTGDHFDGLMDEFHIVDNALTADQINTLMETNTIPDLPPPPTEYIDVTAMIDGRDRLIIRGSTIQWEHFDNAAVGRHDGLDEPTIITSVHGGQTFLDRHEWIPQWSAPPPDQIRRHELSSVFEGLLPGLPLIEQTVELTPAARGEVSIVQQPAAGNDYTLIVEFNDNRYGGHAWYTARIEYVPGASTVSLLAVAGLGLIGRRRK